MSDRWSALMVGGDRGLLGPEGDTWEGNPEHYQRIEVVRADEYDRLRAELAERDAEIERLREACQAALRALDTYVAMYRHHMTLQLISARAGLREVLGGGVG